VKEINIGGIMDLLKSTILEVECAQCDVAYSLPLVVVKESQELLDAGCPGNDYECAARYFAGLIDSAALEQLAVAWRAVEDCANLNNKHARLKGTLKVVLTYEGER